MFWLILSVISATGIFFVFKLADRNRVPSFHLILVNYFIATTLGIILQPIDTISRLIPSGIWLGLSILIGVLFILMFFVVSLSTREAGLSVTTVASKLSVVLPIIFSIIYDAEDKLSLLKSAGILAALTGVLLTVYRKRALEEVSNRFWMPLILFIGMGVVDSLIRLSQYHFVVDENLVVFSIILFSIAFLTGMLIAFTSRKDLSPLLHFKVIYHGLLLGMANFGSIYFLVKSLNYEQNGIRMFDGSVVFGINNLGIVSLSVLLGARLFREQLKLHNWIGISISLLAIILLSWTRN